MIDTSPELDEIALLPPITTSEREVVTATPTSSGNSEARDANPCFDKSVFISDLPSMLTP